jgi:Arc/MetJ family transcription regulator
MAARLDKYISFMHTNMHMRTTLIIKDDLLKSAQEATGIQEKTALIHRGLELLIQKAATERLQRLGASDAKASVGPRKRRQSK